MFSFQNKRFAVGILNFLIIHFCVVCVQAANLLIYDPLDYAATSSASGGSANNINYYAGKFNNAASFLSGSSISYDTEQPFNIYKGTVSMWVKPDFNGADLTNSVPLMGIKLRNGGYFRVYIYSFQANSAYLLLKIKDDNGTIREVNSANTSIGLEDNGNGVRNWVSGNWYYVQISWDLTDSNSKVALRIDENAGEDTVRMTGLDFDNCIINNVLYLGNFETGSGYFNGCIDEFKYTDSYIGTGKMELMFHDSCENLDKMEDINSAIQSDVSFYSRKMITGEEVPRDLSVRIDDSDTLYYPLVAGQNCPVDISTGSVEFWFKPQWNGSDYDENKYLFYLTSTNSDERICIYFYYSAGIRILSAKYIENPSTKRSIEISNSDIINSIIINQWYHLKYYWDHEQNKAELYLNGELIGQYSGTINAFSGNPDKLYIGAASTGVYQADACFDDIKIYAKKHDSFYPEIFKNEPQAVPTYHCMSLYWDIPFGATFDPSYNCTVQYKKQTETNWKDGMDLTWHPYDHEFKGSVVHLAPDTAYDFKLSCGGVTKIITMKTMCEPDNLPVNLTTVLGSGSATIHYSSLTSGSELGYNVYDGQNTAVISGTLNPAVLLMNRSYVILKNFIIDGAETGINIRGNCKNIVLQNITFRNVGNQYENSGVANKSAQIIWVVALKSTDKTRVRRLTIEKCRIENLKYSSNTWFEYHPDPSVNIGYTTCHPAGSGAFRSQNGLEKQLVIRYNEFCSSDGNYYGDVIQGQTGGGLGEDADIYGNYLEYAADDGIEVDEGAINNRVFGNYISNCLMGISSQSIRSGPLYVFRNILEKVSSDYIVPGWGAFAKIGPGCAWMADMECHYPMEYWLNNTILNRNSEGVYRGLYGVAGPKPNVVSLNNIIECRASGDWAISLDSSNAGNIDYNICNKNIAPSNSNYNGTVNTNFTGFYDNLSYWNSLTGEVNAFLDPVSDGYNSALKVNNFTTYFDTGNYPDAGAMDHEKNSNMKFGRNASLYYVSGKWY